jgi:hypothetical protein
MKYKDSLDPEDPGQAHVHIVRNPFSDRRSDTGTNVGRGNEKCHGLAGAILAAKQIRNGSCNVAQSYTSSCSAKELEDDEHGQVEGQRTANVDQGVEEDCDDIDPFAATNITA